MAEVLQGENTGYVVSPREEVHSRFTIDHNGNPQGGVTAGEGFNIAWPTIGRIGGAYLTEIIDGLVQRLSFYQGTKFVCRENEMAIYHLIFGKG